MSVLEKPVKDLTDAEREALKKPFTQGGRPFAIIAVTAANDDNSPLQIYAGPQGCSPS
jgi:hypothetical protein